jgi:Fur family transcriptional regulator, peroxide stress response regulator
MPENYHTRLDAAGIRPSVQRVAVYSYLCEKRNHPTVETVYDALSPSYPTLSRTTIYNTLKLFEEKHLVQSIQIEDDKLRYDADMSQHLHFKCEKCGHIFDIFDDRELPLFTAQCNKLLPAGSKILKVQTNIWGICADCGKKSSDN